MAKLFTPLDLSAIVESVQWGQTWYWDIKFETAPAPFNEWFPAYEVDRGFASINSFEFTGGIGSYRIPSGFGVKDIQMSFYDDENATLENWLDTWTNTTIFSSQQTVATISEIARTVYIAQLDGSHNPVRTHVCLVYPEGQIKSVRNSQTGPALLQVNFTIVGSQTQTN